MENQNVIQLQFDFNAQPVQGTTPVPEALPIRKNGRRAEEKFVFEFMDMLTAPVITFSTAWIDAIPQKLKQNIGFARLIAAMKKEETATIPEVVAYIITRTYESPMTSEWANIYTWCASKYLKDYEHRDVPDDIAPKKLSDYEHSLLKQLRNWIYRKRREAVKSKLK